MEECKCLLEAALEHLESIHSVFHLLICMRHQVIRRATSAAS
jgi:hypothetical protein